MAPQLLPPSTLVFDSRTQIIDNCEFIISKDDIVQVITSKDPADKLFKAYAIRCNEDSREVLLASEPCENAQKAVESLHTKSCEAIHNYVTINGFSSPRDLKTALLEPNLDDDDAASIISGHSDSSTAAFSEWGSSGDEAMMLKHTPDASGAYKDRQHPAGHPGCCAAAAASAREPPADSRSRGAARDTFANPALSRARPARPTRSRSPPIAFRQAPPPPPPGHPGHPGANGANGPPAPPPSMRNLPMPLPPHPYSSGMGVGPHPARPQNNANQSISSAQRFTCFRVPGLPVDGPPFPVMQVANRPSKPSGPNANDSNNGIGTIHGSHPPRPLSVFYPNARSHTVRITVHWLRHGQHRIIAQCQPTRESLQSAAVADVRMNPGAFTSDSPSSIINRDGGRFSLRAQVRQAVFAGEPYDMRTFHGQDLARLFHVMAADDSMPSFEVVVEDFPHDSDDEDDDATSVQGPPSTAKDERWD
ncbi:hypothetical protein ANO14919_005090 [Xylariales sp. No.14919]|nr:hypothetical protein ANO14919_005090 [Xylariales sp. No.14919]